MSTSGGKTCGMILRVMTNEEKRTLSHFIESETENNNREALGKTLKQVALLCRLFNKKAEIIYETENEGLRCITSLVWLTTTRKVVLKEGISIPIPSIRKVKMI